MVEDTVKETEINQFEDADEDAINSSINISKQSDSSFLSIGENQTHKNLKDNQLDIDDEKDSDDDYLEDEYDENDIPSDIGENDPGMVPSKGPNSQVKFIKIQRK
jgi:hypothetical protein